MKYLSLLANQAKIKHEIKEERRALHQKFYIQRKTIFRFMDILVGLMILFNFIAIASTNYMVVKTTPAEQVMQIKEVNPVQAKLNDYELHPEYKQILTSFFKQIGLWFVMIAGYIYYRRTIFTDCALNIMLTLVLFYFTVLGWDCFNDLGYLFALWW